MRCSYLICVALSVVFWTATTTGDLLDSCGQLDEEQVYRETAVAGLDEFPWLGRIYFDPKYVRNEPQFHCVGVLISKRHLLTTAHCFWQSWHLDPRSVLLGDSNYGNDNSKQDCDDSGECAPVAKEYAILDIAIHPKFNIRDRLNDIAVIQLREMVELSAYVQPICLPPPSVYTADFLAQYLTYAGFLKEAKDGLRYEKLKSVAHVKRRERCAGKAVIGDSYLCASSTTGFTYTSGSALMGVNIEDGELVSYYLIGLLSQGTTQNDTQLELFTKISAHINWIRSNVLVMHAPDATPVDEDE